MKPCRMSDLCILNETNLHDCLKMRWKPDLEDQFINKSSELFQNFIQEQDSNNYANIVQSSSTFIKLYKSAGCKMKVKMNSSFIPVQSKWWDKECATAKREKYISLRKFRKNNKKNHG